MQRALRWRLASDAGAEKSAAERKAPTSVIAGRETGVKNAGRLGFQPHLQTQLSTQRPRRDDAGHAPSLEGIKTLSD